MKKEFNNSRIEIWSKDYINNPSARWEEDKNAEILQIEPAINSEDFIVEVREKTQI